MPSIPDHARSSADPHLQRLLDLTQLPTAAGKEHRVIDWINRWVSERPDLAIARDKSGNLVISPCSPWKSSEPPLFVTAHLDHPAFVVERIVSPGTLELSFRGGVMDVFFEDAPIIVHGMETASTRSPARLIGAAPSHSTAGKHYLAELSGTGAAPRVGDIATWDLPPAEISADGILHTHVCDDLAAAAAALSAFDVLRQRSMQGGEVQDVRLLFTRAEEIGFIGAIAACKHGTMPRGSRVIALENSRSFPDSPIGGGPIVRVGDRLSVFTPWLTSACAKRAEDIAGSPAPPAPPQKQGAPPGAHPWQRKLMAGGACEASVFCAFGYDATCLCLPLGNYHNMPHLAELHAGTYDRARHGPPRAAREFISISDYRGLIDLLVAIGERLVRTDPVMERVEKLYSEKKQILD